jgi:SdrD B-like domain
VTLTLTGTTSSGIGITTNTTTDLNGAYAFSEPPGTYTVTVDASNSTGALLGYAPTAVNQGTPATDSNLSPSATTPATLASGGADNTIDFGYYKPVKIGDFVWVDSNGNGIQDSGEPGIAGVVLTLTGTNAAGVVITNQVTTDSLGYYHFSEAPGIYLVTVDPTNSATGGVLVGYAPTATGQGTTDTDSNPNPTGTAPAALISGAVDSSVDFGYYIPVTIGDFVWLDANRDGVQDLTEAGIVGVTLTLKGTTAAGESKTDHATTDSTGHYQFSEAPGTYTVTVDDSNSTASLSGYIPTVTGQGALDTDSNVDPSGTTPDLLLSGGSDSTIDFGYIVAPPTAARLSTFTAQRVSANAVEVEWRALADSDVIGFLVERHDSTGWVRVTSHLIPLIGNGRTPKTYSLSDTSGASAYHLLAVDRLGNTQVIGTAIPNIGTVLRLTSDTSSLNIQLFGTPKAAVGVESSTDLTSGNWTDAGTVQLDATGAAVFTAPVDKDSAKRFYRFTEK